MSMLDSFFNKGFKATKCKTIPRIKLLRNRREIQIRQMRRDIANLLATGQEATARIRVEQIVREENMMVAQGLSNCSASSLPCAFPLSRLKAPATSIAVDETYFAYPNLFGNPAGGSGAQSPTDSSHPTSRF